MASSSGGRGGGGREPREAAKGPRRDEGTPELSAEARAAQLEELNRQLRLEVAEPLGQPRDDLSIMLETAQAASSSLELDEVLCLVARGLARAVGVHNCAIYLVDQDKGVLLPTCGVYSGAGGPVRSVSGALSTDAQRSLADAYWGQPLDPTRDAFLLQVLQSKETLACYDARRDPRTDKEIVALLGLKSVLSVPFVARGSVVAVAMLVTFEAVHSFTERQITMARGIASTAAIAIDNARLYAETKRRADEAQTFLGVQEAITSRLDPDAVLQLIADEARRLTGVRLASVFLLEGDDLRIAVVSGEERLDLLGLRIPVRQSLSGVSILSGKPVCSNDVVNDPSANLDVVRRAGIRSFLGVPLKSGSRPIGMIGAADKLTGDFGPEDERVLAMLASGAAIGIENARLFGDTKRRTKELATLNAIAAVVSHSLHLQEVLGDALDKTLQVLGMETGAAFRLDEEGQTLVLVEQRGLSGEFARYITRLPLGSGASGKAATVRRPVVRKLADYPEGELRRMIEREGFLLVVSVPLLAKGKVLGAINASTRFPRELAAEEISLLAAIGQQVGVAVENARLYEQAEQSAAAAERSRLARDLHDAVTQTLFSASLIAEVLPRLWERNQEEGRRRLEELRQLTRGALAEMRTLLLELRPAALTEAALPDLLRHLTEATTGRSRVPVSLIVEGASLLPSEVQVSVYRIAQEALNNVAKHASATRASVALRCQTGCLELRVSDDGRGFDAGAITAEHLGLGIMRERAEAIGAQLTIDSKPGQGTRVQVAWPG